MSVTEILHMSRYSLVDLDNRVL